MNREILLVEDSDDDYESFRRTCDAVGFRGAVRRFCDGDEALEYLRSLPLSGGDRSAAPALILLDLNLAGTDGREVLAQIKGHPVLKMIPVVVLTTSDNERDVAFCYRNHANGYQLKPMDIDKLESDVRAMVDYWFSAALLPTPTAA
ncbi:MAG: response regulator [Polyangiales bacterium]